VNKELNRRGYRTLVFDNLSRGHREFAKWGEFVLGDLLDIKHLRLTFRRYSIDAVMHFAALTYVDESVKDPQAYYLNNFKGTLNLLQVMLESGVNRFIFSSTCAIYGVPLEIPITEEHPKSPINPYGKSKLMVEEILKDYSSAYGLRYVSLRYFNAAGADPECEIGEWQDPPVRLIPSLLDVVYHEDKVFRIFGTDYPTKDGTCVRDFIHVTDLAEAHILALEYLLKGGESEVFNLGNGKGFSVREVIEVVEMVTGRKVRVVEDVRRPGDPPVLVGSSEKARGILGWSPKYKDISVIIKTAWDWHRRLYGELKKDT